MADLSIIESTSEEYDRILIQHPHVFNSAAFNSLNVAKVDHVYYLLFKDSKYRAGIIVGVSSNNLMSPFSSPFGGFSYKSNKITIQQIEQLLKALLKWCNDKNIKKISLTIPPTIYDESNNAKLINILYRTGFANQKLDLNYYFDIRNYPDLRDQHLWKNARKNLNQSLQNNLDILLCKTDNDKKLAYDVIKQNRAEKGFPLRMTMDDVLNTSSIVNTDFFLVLKDKKAIAAAVVFHVKDDIVQVIYWGDLQKYSHYRPMNFLADKIQEHFASSDINYIDLGPSSENSIPNYGLGDFKESIGCKVNLKLTWAVSLQ